MPIGATNALDEPVYAKKFREKFSNILWRQKIFQINKSRDKIAYETSEA